MAPGAETEDSIERSDPARRRPHATTSGMLLAAAATPLGVVESTAGSLLEAPLWLRGAATGVATLLIAASLAITHRFRLGRVLATAGIMGILALAAPLLTGAPAATLAALIATTAAIVLLWKIGAPLLALSRLRRRPLGEGMAQGSAWSALAVWLLWTLAGDDRSVVDTVVVGWAMSSCAALSAQWAYRNRAARRAPALAVMTSLGVTGALMPALWGDWWWMVSSFAGPAAVSAAVVRVPQRLEMEQTSWWEPLLGHPERLFVGTFAALCAAGTALLALPQSARSGESIGVVDAAFTSTSAVCVTGLIVLDTPVDFGAFGQVVILVLIQIGGLGIMTFSTAALWALGRRMSLRHEGAVASLLSTQDRGRLFATAKRILQLTIVTEGAGAVLLAGAFVARGDTLPMALWRGLFTAISAFCNAGFALQSDSLIPYQDAPFILHTVGALIVLGGLSPIALFAAPAVLRRAAAPVSTQARLALYAAVVLLIGGFAFFLAFEWNDALRGLSIADKLHNAWFQSATLRTAGFNSVDVAVVRPATLMLMLLWMFIGGSPGGTAGGVKTTTISVLALSVVHAIRGQWTLEVFGRTISERTRAKAAVVVAIAASTGLVALVAVLLTQSMPARLAVFEVVSALGTVGLSIGGTTALDGIGKTIIMMSMFVGRVGGLTLLMFLGSRRAAPPLGRPEEEIDVG